MSDFPMVKKKNGNYGFRESDLRATFHRILTETESDKHVDLNAFVEWDAAGCGSPSCLGGWAAWNSKTYGPRTLPLTLKVGGGQEIDHDTLECAGGKERYASCDIDWDFIGLSKDIGYFDRNLIASAGESVYDRDLELLGSFVPRVAASIPSDWGKGNEQALRLYRTCNKDLALFRLVRAAGYEAEVALAAMQDKSWPVGITPGEPADAIVVSVLYHQVSEQ